MLFIRMNQLNRQSQAILETSIQDKQLRDHVMRATEKSEQVIK